MRQPGQSNQVSDEGEGKEGGGSWEGMASERGNLPCAERFPALSIRGLESTPFILPHFAVGMLTTDMPPLLLSSCVRERGGDFSETKRHKGAPESAS